MWIAGAGAQVLLCGLVGFGGDFAPVFDGRARRPFLAVVFAPVFVDLVRTFPMKTRQNLASDRANPAPPEQ
ncbi:MAG: hypothetical protein AB7U97_05235 [Pirellulales bacterium]